MSRLFTVAEICDLALGKIGSNPTRTSGSRAEDVETARYWLDMVVGHQAARARTWWLVPATASFTIQEAVAAYDLASVLSATQAPNGVAFVITVMLCNATTGELIHEIPMVRRREFELRALGGRSDSSPDASPWRWNEMEQGPSTGISPGQPNVCYVTRDQAPTITFSPTPDQDYTCKVVIQSYSKDFVAADPTERVLNLRSSWNMWLVTTLAAALGSGPIRMLPADEVKTMKNESIVLRGELEAYDVHEAQTAGRRVAYHDF